MSHIIQGNAIHDHHVFVAITASNTQFGRQIIVCTNPGQHLNIPQYIYRTWDENTRPTLSELRETNTQQFIKLDIISTSQGGQTDKSENTGTVEFSATYTLPNDEKQHTHRENSTFIKRKNRWYYVDALR